jgi:uncharacterized protein YegL
MSLNRNRKTGAFTIIALIVGGIILANAFMKSRSPAPSVVSNEQAPAPVQDISAWPPVASGVPLAENLTGSNYYVVLDGSGSMSESACRGSGTKIEQARTALEAFSTAVPRNANLGFMVFHGLSINEVVPLGTGNQDAFARAVRVVTPSGGTPLSNVVDEARKRLETQAQKQLGYGEYHLVIVTDGEANAGYDPTDQVNALLASTPIIVHTIGFCIDEHHSLNQPGRTLYQAANDTRELQQGLEDVLAEAPTFTVQTFDQ